MMGHQNAPSARHRVAPCQKFFFGPKQWQNLISSNARLASIASSVQPKCKTKQKQNKTKQKNKKKKEKKKKKERKKKKEKKEKANVALHGGRHGQGAAQEEVPPR